MNLYIEVENGQIKNHPAFENNLIQAFGVIPENWEPFVRVERPMLGVYQVLGSEEPTYEKINGVWTDVWYVQDIPETEKITKQQQVKDFWASRPNFTAWTFDEATCSFQPPIPAPTDGKEYFWQGTTSSWVELPQYPDDGKQYRLNIASATWVEVSQ